MLILKNLVENERMASGNEMILGEFVTPKKKKVKEQGREDPLLGSTQGAK